MLALQGMPAIYFHSLVGTPSDHAGVEQSGIPRRINRRKFDIGELNDVLNTPGSLQNVVFEGIQKLIRVRIEQPAFHPDADQTYIESKLPEVLAFQRDRHDAGQHILVVVNFGATRIGYDAPGQFSHAVDLLDPTSAAKADGRRWDLDPAQVRWLVAKT
jgi:sucrose phosphorylase